MDIPVKYTLIDESLSDFVENVLASSIIIPLAGINPHDEIKIIKIQGRKDKAFLIHNYLHFQ